MITFLGRVLVAFALLAGGAAHAQTTLKAALGRHQKYFDRAERAVLNGAVRPHALELGAGVAVALPHVLGGHVEAGLTTATLRGMDHDGKFIRGSLMAGVDGAAGAMAMAGHRVGKRSMQTPGALFPLEEVRLQARFGLSGDMNAGLGKAGFTVFAKRRGLSWGAGVSAGVSIQGARFSSSRKTKMLQRIEQGREFSVLGLEAVERGDEIGASRALAAAESLRSAVNQEKRELNKMFNGKYGNFVKSDPPTAGN